MIRKQRLIIILSHFGHLKCPFNISILLKQYKCQGKRPDVSRLARLSHKVWLLPFLALVGGLGYYGVRGLGDVNRLLAGDAQANS